MEYAVKKFIDFLTKNDEPVGLKSLKLETTKLNNNPIDKNPWETPIFVRQGEFYKSLKKIENNRF
jgi:hypothetical protein